MRSLLSILLIGVPVTLILCLVGLSHGFLEDSQRRTRGIGADVIVRPPGSTLLTLSGGISDKIVDWLGQQPHVKIAVGAVKPTRPGHHAGSNRHQSEAIRPDERGLHLPSRRPLSRPQRGHHRPVLRGPATRACGGPDRHPEHPMARLRHHRGGKLAHIVFPLGVLQEKTSNVGKVSQI